MLDLKSLLMEIQALPLERFVFKTKDGLLDFEKLVKQFPETLGFIVIKPYMRFDDLMGNVKNYGISYPGILNLALSDSYYPKGVTIGDNLEKLSLLQKIQHDLMAITQRNLMFFDTDEEFADFVIQPSYCYFDDKRCDFMLEGEFSANGFENPLKIQLLNAFKLAFVQPVRTIMLWMIWLSPVLLALAMPVEVLAHVGFLYIAMGISLPAFWAARVLRDVFDKVNGAPVIPE